MTESDSDLDSTLPCTQGNTQPTGNSQAVSSQSQSQSLQYWGRLCPLSRRLKHHDLSEKTVTFGTKSSNSIVILEEQVEKVFYKYIDEVHFRIERDSVLMKGSKLYRAQVKIYDLSCHGLFVNGSKVRSKSNLRLSRSDETDLSDPPCVELKSNDVISLPTNGKKIYDSDFDAFVFIDSYAPVPMHFPKIVTQNYHVSRKLGSGAFGEVHLVSRKMNGENSAMKAIMQSLPNSGHGTKQRAKLFNELEILKTINHPNVVKLNDVIVDRKECFVFLEFMEGNDLAEKISKLGKLSEELTRLFFYQICMGVKYLHSNRIIHRDIKPANILLASKSNETIVKLTDFGLSKVLKSSEHMKTFCGTKMYAAPELLSCKNEGKYTAQVDVWSLGVLLFVCLSGDEPFAAEPHLVEKHIMKALYVMTPDVWKNVTVFAKNLVDSMLIIDPNKRIRLNDIMDDDWFKSSSLRVKLRGLYNCLGFPVPEDDLPSNPCKKIKLTHR